MVGDVRVAAGERRAGVDVALAADDRLHGGLLGRVVEGHRAVHDAVVGHGHGRHAELRGPGQERLEVAGAVEHAVLGVQVEVDKGLGHGHGFLGAGHSRSMAAAAAASAPPPPSRALTSSSPARAASRAAGSVR